MTKNFNTARSEYKRQLENLISSQAQAEVQNAGTRGRNAMNQTASTVSAQIDPGKIDGVKYAETLAQGIAEIKAAQQKQLEEQLKQQAKEIAAQQKAAAKANAKAEKKQEQAEQSVQAEQGVRDDENAAKGQWTPWGEQSPVVGPVRSSGTKKPSDETAAAAGTKAEAERAQTDEKAQKVAELKALNRSQAKARAESRAMRETNAGLLNKEKLTEAEKEEIYRRVNTWAEDPKNKETMERLKMAKNKNRVADLLEAGYTTEQLDEAEEYLRLYKKMGVGQRLEERVGKTMLGAGKTMLSAVPQAWDAGVQTVKNAKASLTDEEYRNAVGQQNAALMRMQELELSGEAVQRDENGNPAGYTDEYKELQKKLADAQAVMTARDSEINAPVSQDTYGYKLWESGQKDLARSDLGLEGSQKFIKGAVTSAAENIALAMINPALVLPGLSAQGAADSFGQSTQNGEAAMTGLAKGVAKGLAGYAINSVGVEQMLDTMGAAGTRKTMAANIVQYLKNQSKLSGIAKSNPALYAVLMGATDNGLQSFAETWADYAIDLATNTAEPMSAEQLMMQSLQSMASGAVGGAATAVAGMGVNAGRRAAYERAQDAQDAQNAQMAPENAQNVTENAQAAQNEPAAAADNMKATGDNLPPIQPATDYKNATVAAPAEQTAATPAMRNDIIALKENLEQGSEIKPRIAQMFLKQGSTEEMKQRKQENRKALAQMLGVEENEIPTTLKAAREYLAKVDASKLVMQQAQESQSPAGQNSEVQSNAAGERAGSEPMLRAVPMESVPEEMQQVAREISESTGARVEYFESDNPRALGAYENGTLSLNKSLNTKEAAQQTIVHEFTHWMEGTNTYSKMRQYITDSRILQEAARAATGLNEPPQGMSWAEAWQQKILEDYAAAGIQADAEKEMIAKLCEKYLFYNEDAVNKICRENMSLAETVLDWVREMISRVRGATMEAELRHIERLYRKGIAEAKGQAEQENKEKQYKVLEDAYSGQSFVQVDEDILNGVPKSQWAKTVREEMKRRYPNGVKIGGWTVDVNSDSRAEFTKSKDTQWLQRNNKSAYKDKMRMVSNIEEIVNAATNVRNEAIKHNRKDNYQSFNHAEALIRVGGNGYIADIVTAIKPSTKEVFYDVVRLTPQKIKEDRSKRYSEDPASAYGEQPSITGNVAPNNENVKPGNGKQFSIADTDSEENALAERQRAMEETAEKAFAKSEVRDENGKLLPVYHATDESFTRFSKNKLGSFTKDVASDDSMVATAKMGFWFNEKDLREKTFQEKSIKAYLNIENPYETSLYELANLLESSEGNTPGKKAENLRRELQDQGYDGLAVQDEEFGGKSYVAFEPNQIKSAEPVTYSNSGKEIPLSKRFNKNKEDIRFSLADPVEETRDLVAVHNSSVEGLMESLKLGGLPSPSIAIVKAKGGHTKYGDVSLVFDKNTIDPAAQKKNKVYGSDAWAPTKPRVDYKVNRDKARAFENDIAELSKKIAGGIFSRSGVLAARGIENETNLKLSDIIEKMAGDDTVRAAYLADQGKTLEPEKKAKEFSRKLKNEMLSSIIDHVGIENIANAVAEMEATESDEPVEKIYGSVKEVIQKDYEQKMQKFIARKGEAAVKAKVQNYMNDNWTQGRVADEVQNAWKMYQDGGKTKGEIDRIATSDKLREAVDDKMVARWAKEKLDGLLDEAGIYNGKDPFTASGHRRSFAQLHNAYTLENLVAAMNKQQSARGEGLWGATASGMQAVASPEYRSVSEIKADESRLAHMNEDEISAALKVVDEKIEDVIGLIRKETEAHSSNSFEENDIIGGLLVENVQKKTISSIKAAFAKDGYAISQETARQILLMYRKAAKLPTEYFEAKPQRAVGFGEVKAAIVPDDAQSDFVDALKNAGVQEVVLYKAGDEADRLNKLNELEDVRFSMEENEGTVSREEISRGRFARAAKARENGDSMLRALFVEEDIAEETMRVMETVRNESWRILRDTEESQRTAGQKVLDRSANGIAWALKREYHSSTDRAGLKEKLIELYADMEGKNITMEEAIGRARKIGRELVQTARPERRANTELMDAYGDAYQSLTGQVIRITDSELQSILHRWGSLREFRRDTGNKIRVSTEDGVPIDALWGELSETNTGKFEADTNDGDRVDAIANFVNELRPQEVQRYAGVEKETAEEIGERIIDGFVDGKVRTEKERVRKEVQKEVRRQVKKGVERLNADNYEYRQELGKEKKKIERMAERMGRKLASPTRQQHIVADADVQRVVQSIADDALAIVTGRFAGEDKLPYVGQKLVALSNSLSHLATTDHRYAGFMTVDANGNAVPVDFVRNLNDLAEAMNKIHQENPSISDLDLETARELRETLERVEHELETADKLLSNTIGAEHRESAEKTAQEVYKEIDESRRLSTYNKSIGAKIFRAAGDTAVKYNFGLLNPTRIARMMTNYAKNSAFVEVADAINRGQRKMMLLKSQASAIFADVSNDEFTLGMKKENRKSKTGLGYTKADYDAFSGRNAQKLDVGFRDADTGEIVYITPAMRAELAMHLMNAHNRERVLYGGLMIPDAEQLCKGNTQEATKLSHRVKFDLSDPDAAMIKLADIVDGMSDYEAQWIKAAKEYFWNYSGKQYNKVTIDLWGYEAANVVNYYPAASDTKNLYQNVAQRGQANFTVENNSNLKERVYKARKPIALNEINRTARKSIDTMSRFCGLAMPMRDFEKIYNYQEQEGGKNIKGVMDRVWNGKASQYWEDVMADTNGSRSKVKDGIAKVFAKFRGNYATSVLYANASTAMKQAASFPTAAAAIGWKPLAEGLANYKNVGQETLTEINKRVATYSMRNGDGNSIYDVGDTSSLLAQTVNKLPGAGWITKADDATVKVLSAAAKAYVDENIGNLQKGSTEYWDKVADVYADCIELTQPNNGTMQLSALSRSQSEVVRGVTMFSNQRIQNYGLMWDAVADLHAQQARLKAEPGNAELQAEVKRAKVKFANTMSAMAVQSLMIGLMTAAGKALWRKMDDYRDDTGKVTSKSFWTKIMWDSLGSFGSNFIGISDIVDIGRYIADKDYMHFDFAVPELEAINDFVDKTRKFSLAVQNCWENEDPDKDKELADNLWKASKAMAEETGKVLGVPLVNIRKNVSGVWNGVLGEINGDGWLGKYEYTNENLRSMMDDYMAGSYEVDGINEMLEKWCVSKYGKAFGDMEKADRDTAASAMREQAAKNWKDAYVSGTDAERKEIADKLEAIRVGDRKLFTTKVLSGWVDSWENKIITQETKERAGQLFDTAAENLTGQKLYKSMSEEEQIDLESSLNEAAKTAAKLEAGYMITSDLGEGEMYLYERTGKDKEKWLDLKAKYLMVSAQAKKVAQKGENGTGMAEFLRALEKSGYSTADMGALLQAKGGGDKLKNVSDEVRLEYYRAKNNYADADNSGSMNQEEFMAYVGKSGMKRSVANEIWNMIWKPGKKGSTSPYQ
nr:MAG TPA: nuclease [Bacteriophage sp.]